MSSPYVPRGLLHGARATLPPTQVWQRLWGVQFFYQAASQQPGVAEAELEQNVRTSLRRFLYGGSGDTIPAERWHPLLRLHIHAAGLAALPRDYFLDQSQSESLLSSGA
jgi:hypothetical protein